MSTASTRETLRIAYGDLSRDVAGLDEAAAWLPTGCAGWSVRDLVFHHLGDAQRALVALGTPSGRPPDRDSVSYWTDAPGRPDAESRGIRATRTMASAWRLDHLLATYAETLAAVVTQSGRLGDDERVGTQGHVLAVEDLVTTLVVEAAVHHLDLVVALDRPGPAGQPLAAVRATLDGLLGRTTPSAWDDASWCLAGTGRRPLTPVEQQWLGEDAGRIPLLH